MLVPAGIPVAFTAVFPGAPNPSYVAMSVYDVTAASPSISQTPQQMLQVTDNAFVGKFIPQAGHLYAVFMAVYTGNTYVTINEDFTEVCVPVVCQYLTPPVQNIIGLVGCQNPLTSPQPSPFQIYQGDAKVMAIQVIQAGPGLVPLDLTLCTAISVSLPNADGSTTVLIMAEGWVDITAPPNLGQIQFPIASDVSVLLNVGELQQVDVTFTIGATVATVGIPNALSVYQQPSV